MAAFKELKGKLTGWVFLFVGLITLFVFLLWDIPGSELSSVESAYALQSTSPNFTILDYFSPDTPICYLVLVKIANMCGVPMEWSLRLISIFSYLLLMALVIYTVRWDKTQGNNQNALQPYANASSKQEDIELKRKKRQERKTERRNHNIYAAGAATVFMFSFIVVHKDLVVGCPHPLTALGLYSGWMLWLELAVLKKKTGHLAWILLGVFSALIYLNAGALGVVLFLLPLMCQSRPLNIWDKISQHKSSFAVFIILLMAAILFCWYQLVSTMPNTSLFTSKVNSWNDVLYFPLKWMWYLFPGSLLMWVPFCAALIPLHKNPLRGRFLRVVFWTNFLFLWFFPSYDERNFILMTPVMAVMLGSYFWIIAQRHGKKITCLLNALAGCVFIFSLALLADVNWNDANYTREVLESLHEKDLIPHLTISKKVAPLSLFQLFMALAANSAALFFLNKKEWGKKEWIKKEWIKVKGNDGETYWQEVQKELSPEEQREKKNYPLWISIFLILCSCFELHAFFRELEHSKREHSRQIFAENMSKCLMQKEKAPVGTIVYTSDFKKYTEYYYFMHGEGQYKIKYIKDIKDLPDVDTAYYLGTRIPEFIHHQWTNLEDISPRNEQSKQNIYSIYKGTKETKQEATDKK